MHYQRQYRYGSTEKRRTRKTCSADGCDRPAHGRGLCGAHYVRWYSGSSADGPITPVHGAPPLTEPPPHLTRAEWVIYAAGFVDGEGCIAIIHAGALRHYLEVSVAQADPTPLRILQSLWGGRICTHGQRTNRPVYYWKASTRQASAAIAEMAPYLIVKRDQAAVALEFVATIGRGRNADDELIAERERLCQEISRLKRKEFTL